MTTHSLSSIRAASIAKDTEEKRIESREKAMLLFTFQLLLDKGYVDTATSLASECSLNLEHYAMCENIDLNSVFIDFEAYYKMRFQRHPQYFKKISNNGPTPVGESLLTKLAKQKRNGATGRTPQQRRGPIADADHSNISSSDCREFITISPMIHNKNDDGQQATDKLLKPISGLDFINEDMRYFADIIQKEIVLKDLQTKWDDVVGLENAKMILMESMVYRNEFSNFFGNALPPWKGLLLYGPPGTGKTLLARAVASECATTFFNISSSSLVSKWRGDSEKIVKVLFELARYHAPSTIFFDEFDALAANRDTAGESDASRRLKSEILQQMDGLLSTNQNETNLQIFVLAATNLPWELDPAIIRRLEKRVHVPLPDADERKEILKLHFTKTAKGIFENSKGKNSLICQIDFQALAQATEGYSGSDLQQLVKESVVYKFRQCFQDKNKLRNDMKSCLKRKNETLHIFTGKLAVDSKDVSHALKNISPTVKPNLDQKFINWTSSFKAV